MFTNTEDQTKLPDAPAPATRTTPFPELNPDMPFADNSQDKIDAARYRAVRDLFVADMAADGTPITAEEFDQKSDVLLRRANTPPQPESQT